MTTSDQRANLPTDPPTDLQLHINESGSGRTMVFSHGVGSDANVWSDFAPVLAPSYRVLAWDQPGHGSSPHAAPDAYGPRLAYGSLEGVIGSSEGVVLVGHSLGGYLSCRYAIEHPDRVAALVLIATGPGFRSSDAMAKWNADTRRGAEKEGRPERLVGLHEDAYVIDHLADISCPTLVIVGSEDAAFLGATDYIEKKIPGIERLTVDGAGHMIPATHGAQLAGIIAEFLDHRLA